MDPEQRLSSIPPMPLRRSRKSISLPITLGSLAVVLAGALLVGWSILFGQRIAHTDQIGSEVSLLVLGAISFVVIMTVLIVFIVYLARSILEVRRQDSFIDSVTHELKSPLASLKLCLETLGRSEIEPSQREQLRGMMLEDVDRLTSFIDDVLQASLRTHRALAMDARDVDLAEVAQSCATAVANRYHLEEDAIRVEIPRGVILSTDRAALEIVLKNLVDNAVKYSDEVADVRLGMGTDRKGRVVIEVSDRGVGIPPKQLRRVFQRFHRVDDESVRRRRGTGLGLFVVAALVRNLGGHVRASSEGPGRGTTVRVTLPATASAQGRLEIARGTA
jgi:signal transduction histidine kinase